MLIDENTKILYAGREITIENIVNYHAKLSDQSIIKAFIPVSVDVTDILHELPPEELVLRDIYSAPIFIQRSSKHGDLVLLVDVVMREPKHKYDRPYGKITLVPKEGWIKRVMLLPSNLALKIEEPTPDYIEFSGYKNFDLRFRVYYRPVG